ncbi:MAG TPA: glycerophosphodiester phosphodiesterase family protein [Thermomicrobiales bacterium]
MLIYAHRGASAIEPENTLRAFRRALEAGVDGIELDLHATSDRVPVVIHDRDVARTTNGQGLVSSITFEELSKLDAGLGERVPTLDEVLSLVGDRIHLDLEIKQRGIEAEVLAVLDRHPKARWAISSFDWDILRAIRQRSSRAELWLLTMAITDAVFRAARELGATAAALYAPAYTPEAARQLANAGLRAVLWTVNDPAVADELQRRGADALCTDAPEQVAAALRQSSGATGGQPS